MTDFYAELDLDSSKSAEELNRELSKRESVWKSRRTKVPDKATKMLALIVDAREVFKTDETKAQYDFELEESKKEPVAPDPDAERKTAFAKWRNQAEDYFVNGQNDMAFEAARKAEQFMDSANPDAGLLFILSSLWYERGNAQQALQDINEAILIAPDKAYYYSWKAHILGDFFNAAVAQQDGLSAALDYLEQNRANNEKALALSSQGYDTDEQILILRDLAESYALMYNSDYAKAENYAKQAMALGDNSPELKELLHGIELDKQSLKPYQGASHPSETAKSGGCYIATAVYGSYDCPEVWTLRRFRDHTLALNVFGRAFIKCYYAVSPKIVKLFGNKRWFNTFWRRWLDSFVSRLQRKGVSSDRYFD